MITARQSRAARALLGWTQETLADKARISLTALKRLESENRLEVYETTREQARRRRLLAGGRAVGPGEQRRDVVLHHVEHDLPCGILEGEALCKSQSGHSHKSG